MQNQRVFEDTEAKREAVPLMMGLVGPSGGGKTFSGLRLATGIQRITGGDIHVIDSEARRALHYADRFKFRHVPFAAPFDPLSYLGAIEHCAQKGAKVVVVDSMSHEHEGPGGVLEMHAAEIDRMCELYEKKNPGRNANPDAYKMLAWQKPKSERRRMINTILQLQISTIFCFRAKEKLKIVTGKSPVPLGYMAIAGEEFLYEMTVCCLLLPRADGVPTWASDEIGERETMKLPVQFKDIFAPKAPLSEDIGTALAQWAAGTDAPDVEAHISKIQAIGASGALAELDAMGPELTRFFPKGTKHFEAVGKAFKAAKAAIVARTKATPAQQAPAQSPRGFVDPADDTRE